MASIAMVIPGPFAPVLADPNVVYVLFILGIIGLVGEFHHPGTILPGLVGGIALVLALLGFIVLGVNWIAVALVALAAVLFVAEAHTSGFGLLGLGGILAFVAGSLLLFTPFWGQAQASSDNHVSPWLIALSAIALGGYVAIVLRAVLRSRHLPSRSGREALLGKEGVAISDLTPRGTVRAAGEDWSAVADIGPIQAGEAVEVIGVEGITLRVRRPYEWRLPDGLSE
ncbi:MAG TPA: NfeD family protein [Ktedonobacterales bacterium]|nr:NfeD family protein [Ktedonobacterales bacterium]